MAVWVGSVALLVARRTNDRKVAGSRPTKVVCITVLTGNRMGWTAHCGRPPLLLPSCRKLEFRLSVLMDSDLAWVNGKSGRQSWCYADAFQRSIISEAIYHFTISSTRCAGQDLALTIGTETIQPTSVVRDLGVWLDSELSLKQHVYKVAKACFYQLRRLRQIRRRVGREVTTRLVLALVTS